MTVKERLIEYLRYKNISNAKFCKAIGVSSAFISSMRKSIQPDKAESIALMFPDLNTGWLLTGEGNMLKGIQEDDLKQEESGEYISIPKELLYIMRKQVDSLEKKDAQIDELIKIIKDSIINRKAEI